MTKKLLNLIDNFSKARILCIGDIMLDKFIQGKVEKISPEAPVPIFLFSQERQMLGGAGNVVANLKSLSCYTYFIGILGKDKHGEDVASLLSQARAEYYLIRSQMRQTTMKARFISGTHHVLRFDQEKIMPLTDLEERELLSVVSKHIKNTDCVILSDYAKGIFTPSSTRKIIEIAKEAGKDVLVDPKGTDYSKYAGAFLIKPNRKELEVVSKKSFEPTSADFLKDLSAAAHEILDAYEIENMIITLSEKGMLYIPRSKQKKEVYLPTDAKEVFDVSGAGDTSIAAIAIALASGATIEEAMSLANSAAGVVVGKVGTATLTTEELREKILCRKLKTQRD